MPRPFIIYSLPRSRTYWLSRFLTYRDWHCGHDEVKHLRSMQDIADWFKQPKIGTVETGAAGFWRLAPSNAQVVTIRRNPEEVIESLLRVYPSFDRTILTTRIDKLDKKLDQIERRVPGVLRIDYQDLDIRVQEIFEKCLNEPWDAAWFQEIKRFNLQIDFYREMKYFAAYSEQLAKLSSIVKQRTLALLAMQRPAKSANQPTIREVSFQQFHDKCQGLFAQHCALVGETSENWKNKNWEMTRKLAEVGCVQILIAENNTGVCGYLMTVLSPSLEREGEISALNTTVYVRPDYPGLGRKMRKEAKKRLVEKGITELFHKTMPRGDGPRLARVLEREGAELQGNIYLENLRGL